MFFSFISRENLSLPTTHGVTGRDGVVCPSLTRNRLMALRSRDARRAHRLRHAFSWWRHTRPWREGGAEGDGCGRAGTPGCKRTCCLCSGPCAPGTCRPPHRQQRRAGEGPAPPLCRPRQAGCCSRDASLFVSDASKRWHGSGPSRWETGPLTRRGPVPQGCRAGPNPEGTGQLKGPAGSVLGTRTATAGDQPAALRRRVEPGLERRGGVSLASCSDSEVRGLPVTAR